jgi:hypothetical protein
MAGKGDKPRPFSVSQKEFDERWGKIDWTSGKNQNFSHKNNNNVKANSKSKSSNKIFIRKGQ